MASGLPSGIRTYDLSYGQINVLLSFVLCKPPVLAMASKKSVQPPRRRQLAKFSLPPITKIVEDLLFDKRSNPSSVDQRTSERYAALLSLKDEFDIYFFLSKTSPDLCVTDAYKFLYRCLDHFLLRVMSTEIAEQKTTQIEFLGQPPAPFERACEVDYIAYLKWIESGACDDKLKHVMILYRAECLLTQLLEKKGFKLPEGVSASEWLQRDARQYDEVDRRERSVAAHLFTSLLRMERDDTFTSYNSDFPSSRRDVLEDMTALGKKVLVLEHLKSKLPKFGASSTSMEAALFLIEAFLGSQVRRCQEVSYGDSRVMIPGILPANKSVLKL